ncbi:MAG: phytase [bacterium]
MRHKSFGQKTQVNGVVIDQEKDLLYVTVSKPVSTVSVFSLPGGKFVREFIRGKKNLRKEPGIDLYFRPNGETWAYVSSDKIFYIYHVETGEFLNEFKPKMSVETILTDEYYGVVYVPDENKKKGVFAYKPDWTPYIKNGTNVFGANRIFQADGEGILLYTLLNDEMGDSGAGFIVVVDQKKKLTDFEFFDRRTWEHLGTLRLKGVSNTDGIASTQQALPKYPVGLFVAINNDKTTAGIGWDKVFAATGLLEIAK